MLPGFMRKPSISVAPSASYTTLYGRESQYDTPIGQHEPRSVLLLVDKGTRTVHLLGDRRRGCVPVRSADAHVALQPAPL